MPEMLRSFVAVTALCAARVPEDDSAALECHSERSEEPMYFNARAHHSACLLTLSRTPMQARVMKMEDPP